ncbi:MAG: hypothetical protein U0807_10145 [Candidatus Binatia bacterium]
MRAACAGGLLGLGIVAGALPAHGVVVGDGVHVERVDVGLDIATARGVVSLPALVWTAAGGALAGHTRADVIDATVGLAPSEEGLRLTVALRWAADVAVEREVVHLGLRGAAFAIGRDLGWGPVGGTVRVDRATPILVATGTLAVAGGAGFVAARYRPGHEAAGAPVVGIDLVLDDAAAHPFAVYDRCREALPAPPIDWAALERRTAMSNRRRAAGEVVHAEATILGLAPASSPLPLVVERWPRGARAAVVVTDHADRTDPRALRAVLYGTSDRAAAGYGRRGLLGHGLRVTKTFFAEGHVGALAGDPEARALADELVAAGSEVGSHSISEGRDAREAVANGLAAFDRWGVVTWIDHEPYTNCEALAAQGWAAGGAFGIRDLLVTHGYRWAWAAGDVAPRDGLRVTDLFDGPDAAAAPVAFPFPLDPRLWLFRSVWFYAPPAALAAALDDRALDALEQRRGLFVAHTSLAASAATTRSPAHRRALCVHATPSGALEIDPALDAAFARLGARVRVGTLASLTWRGAGDRLRALDAVAVRYRADGSASVENRGDTRVEGLTVAIPSGDVDIRVDGAVPAGARRDRERTIAWLDLAPGGAATVTASRGAQRVPLLAQRPLAVRERP